jgi:hypothetical protein
MPTHGHAPANPAIAAKRMHPAMIIRAPKTMPSACALPWGQGRRGRLIQPTSSSLSASDRASSRAWGRGPQRRRAGHGASSRSYESQKSLTVRATPASSLPRGLPSPPEPHLDGTVPVLARQGGGRRESALERTGVGAKHVVDDLERLVPHCGDRLADPTDRRREPVHDLADERLHVGVHLRDERQIVERAVADRDGRRVGHGIQQFLLVRGSRWQASRTDSMRAMLARICARIACTRASVSSPEAAAPVGTRAAAVAARSETPSFIVSAPGPDDTMSIRGDGRTFPMRTQKLRRDRRTAPRASRGRCRPSARRRPSTDGPGDRLGALRDPRDRSGTGRRPRTISVSANCSSRNT